MTVAIRYFLPLMRLTTNVTVNVSPGRTQARGAVRVNVAPKPVAATRPLPSAAARGLRDGDVRGGRRLRGAVGDGRDDVVDAFGRVDV